MPNISAKRLRILTLTIQANTIPTTLTDRVYTKNRDFFKVRSKKLKYEIVPKKLLCYSHYLKSKLDSKSEELLS